jgi:hypothetical protein
MKHQEADLQKACVKWYRHQYPNDGHLLYMNHQNGRSMNEQARLKSMGLVAGVADLTLLHDGKAYFIELKVGKNKQTPAQIEFQRAVDNAGFFYQVIYSVEQFMETIKEIKNK